MSDLPKICTTLHGNYYCTVPWPDNQSSSYLIIIETRAHGESGSEILAVGLKFQTHGEISAV
jgi:hypothetical protein